MKTTKLGILILFLIILSISTICAQDYLQKGRFSLGGDGSMSYSHPNSVNKSHNLNINLSVKVGRFVSQRSLVGGILSGGINYYQINSPIRDNSVSGNIGAGVFYRYYVAL